MKQRLNFMEVDPKLIKAMFALGTPIAQSSLDPKLIELINFRVSQINGLRLLSGHALEGPAGCR